MLNYTHSRCQKQAHKCFRGTRALQKRTNLCVINGLSVQQTDGSPEPTNLLNKQTKVEN